MQGKEVYWHIGLAKTATTTFQKHIFPELKTYNYLGRYYDSELGLFVRDNLHNSLVWKDWNRNSQVLDRGSFDLNIEKLINYGFNLDTSKSFFISHEGITSSSVTPQSNGKLLKYARLTSNMKYIVDISNKNNLTPKVIVVLRKQVDYFESLFAQAFYLINEKLGIDDINDYYDFISSDDSQAVLFNLHYYSVIKYIKEQVGESNLLVLPFELLKQNPNGFLKEISDFIREDLTYLAPRLSKKENIRDTGKGKIVNQTPLSIKIKKTLRLERFNFHGIGRLINKTAQKERTSRLSDNRRNEIKAMYLESNKLLCKKYQLFEGFGYL